MSWTLCTSAAAILKAGINANTLVSLSGVSIAEFSDEAEGNFCALTKKDWITDYSKVKTSFKGAIADAVSDMIAIKIINADHSGFTSLNESSTMCDILTDNSQRIINKLDNKTYQDNMF